MGTRLRAPFTARQLVIRCLASWPPNTWPGGDSELSSAHAFCNIGGTAPNHGTNSTLPTKSTTLSSPPTRVPHPLSVLGQAGAMIDRPRHVYLSIYCIVSASSFPCSHMPQDSRIRAIHLT